MTRALIAVMAATLAGGGAALAQPAAPPQVTASPTPQGPAASAPAVTVSGAIRDGALEGDVVWFTLHGVDLRFLHQAAPGSDPQLVLELLRQAAKANGEIKVVFDSAPAGIDPETALPRVLVAALSYDGREMAGVVTPAPPPSDEPRSRAVAAASAAVIALVGLDPAAARSWATQALDSGRLPPKLKALALKTRAKASDDLASELPPGLEGDRLFLAAYHDFEAWSAAEPGESEAAFGAAGALRSLGVYDEALVRYRRILERWPKEDHWASMRIAGTLRAMGRAEEALTVIDGYARRAGRQSGMPFHYHRARTLNELGRFDEAAREIGIGLKAQPDYAWAFIARACALGQAGRSREALADARRALAINTALLPGNRASPAADHNMAWVRTTVEVLEKAATGRRVRSDVACKGAWPADRRDRSPLLPVDSPIPPAPATAEA